VSPRTIAQLSWWFASLVAVGAISLAEAILRSWLGLLVAAVVAAVAYGLGHRHGRNVARTEAIASRLAEIDSLGGQS
jgi:hypothetical protein